MQGTTVLTCTAPGCDRELAADALEPYCSYSCKRAALYKQSRTTAQPVAVEHDEAAATTLALYGSDRPRVRGDCAPGVINGPESADQFEDGEYRVRERHCPWVSCKYHLAVDRDQTQPDGLRLYGDPAEMKQTCALDIAAEGGVSTDEIASALGISEQRVRKLEENAQPKFESRLAALGRRLGFTIDDLLPPPRAEPLFENMTSEENDE